LNAQTLDKKSGIGGGFDPWAYIGRSDVKFDVKGFGEDQTSSTFDNKLPEERFYNRTVIIDIISTKEFEIKLYLKKVFIRTYFFSV